MKNKKSTTRKSIGVTAKGAGCEKLVSSFRWATFTNDF